MATMGEFKRRVEAFNLQQEASTALRDKVDKLHDLQEYQLMQGKGADGRLLRPSILDDPYFKDREAAQKYAEWKRRLYPETPYGVANLRINGYYHEGISIKVATDKVMYDNSRSFAASVANKYGNKELGLNDDSRGLAYQDIVKPAIVKAFKTKTGAK